MGDPVLTPLVYRQREENELENVVSELRNLFARYQVANLTSIGADAFCHHIQSQVGIENAEAEGYGQSEVDRQRDLSIHFSWGHNHDFGDLKLEGKMGDRHINLLANFLTLFSLTPGDFHDRSVFDIGCWTGGTTLLLAALGSRVTAIEEVKKYAEMVRFLIKSFDLDDRVSVKSQSIYECNSEEFHDCFDIVYFPGVIYHLSDPVLALRILYNSLKMKGIILIESAGIDVPEPYCRFWGNKPVQKDQNSGWAWFWPSPSALTRMMKEAGFDDIEVKWHRKTHRIYGYARKTSQVGICRAGLSVKDIK